MTSQAQLIDAIKAHIARGDKAVEKAEQHYISAGQHLVTLKKQHKGNWADWEKLLKTKIDMSAGRASELMQIADGRKTFAQVRADNAGRNKQLRDRRSSSRDEEQVAKDKREVQELARKVQEAERAYEEAGCDPAADDAQLGGVTFAPAELIHSLVSKAHLARDLTYLWRKTEVENTAESAKAAAEVAETWGEIATALGNYNDEKDADEYYEGSIKKLVTSERRRNQRYAREGKKFGDEVKKLQEEQQADIDRLVARLVDLNIDVARGVFCALGMRGPCGFWEGPNFFLATPFAIALGDAIYKKTGLPPDPGAACAAKAETNADDPASSAADAAIDEPPKIEPVKLIIEDRPIPVTRIEAQYAPNDPGPIPEFLRRVAK
jgi:hypothetical protein